MVHARHMVPVSFNDVLAANIRSARTRLRLEQESVAARMRALGYAYWTRQTLSKVERGNRRVLAEEVPGLAVALGRTVSRLMAPVDEDGAVRLYGDGPPISALFLRLSAVGQTPAGEVEWDGDKPVIAGPDYPPGAVDVMQRMAAGEWPPSGGER